MELAALKKRIAQVLEGHDNILFPCLYGSAAQGRMGPRSDVDIALAGEDPLSLDQRLTLMSELSLSLGREVDLLDLQSAEGLIFNKAIAGCQVVLNRKPDLYAAFMRILWYSEADWMPYYRRIVEAQNRRNFGLDEPSSK